MNYQIIKDEKLLVILKTRKYVRAKENYLKYSAYYY